MHWKKFWRKLTQAQANGVDLGPPPRNAVSAGSPAVPGIPGMVNEGFVPLPSAGADTCSLTFSSRAPLFAAGSKDMKVRVYDSRNFNLIQTLDHSSADCERRHAPSVALGECYQPLLLTGTVGEARVYDTSKHSWKLVDTLGHPSSCGVTDSMVSAVAFSRGAYVTASGCNVHVCDTEHAPQTLEHPSPVSAIAVSTISYSVHHFLATAYDNTMRVYNSRLFHRNADPELTLTLEYSSSICSLVSE